MKAFVIGIGLCVAGQGMAWAAECPPGTTLQVIGGVRTGVADLTQNISTGGHLVRATRVSCGPAACVATVYDSDGTNRDAGSVNIDANVKEEPGAPANESRWTTYDPPLTFTEGISFHDDGNVGAFLAYECRP